MENASQWLKRTKDLRASLRRRDSGLKLSTEEIRELLLAQTIRPNQMLWRCLWCRDIMSEATVGLDHFDPLALGGPSTRENLRPCCKQCNIRKRDIGGLEFEALQKLVARWDPRMQTSFWARLTAAPGWRNWKRK